MKSLDLYALGDSAIVVQLGDRIDLETHRKVQMVSKYLEEHSFPGMVEYIPAFTTVTIFYDPLAFLSNIRYDSAEHEEMGRSVFQQVSSAVLRRLETIPDTDVPKPTVIEIPVCYGGDLGPDLEDVAGHNQLSVEEVIQIHSSAEYLTYMVGFAPGFPYLGGLSERIATPRRKTPRVSIPAGSVGIAGMQTGVYPIETPGGWQLIGRTPIRLFRPEQSPPTRIQAGNMIRFRPISRAEYEQLKEREEWR
ncbi:5-oxoprolinase subunit PxpB [Fodinisporobacter ferrooxydans]|uniref:5-oxoprolinase subunit PxpB n=1 Tax=Fodinisporobacter ferrooxydans TaxID=2901836 RepID=A0ABY4CQQ4_9BACL|nr:5-oxoprolinase subunit PxpB [Alicyclobacillaceae bacterium MYW30-H2]